MATDFFFILLGMITFPSAQTHSILRALPVDWEILLLGEMHGSKQNASFMKDVVQCAAQHHLITCFFEWMLQKDEAEALRTYVLRGQTPDSLPTFFLYSDGRFTKEHINLLKWLSEWNVSNPEHTIDISFFDTPIKHSDDPEKELARVLLAYHKRNPTRRLIVETGVFHAKTNPWRFEGQIFEPMGMHLTKGAQVASLFLHYPSGAIRADNDVLDVTDAEIQQKKPQDGFTVCVTMPQSVASEPVADLTGLLEKL